MKKRLSKFDQAVEHQKMNAELARQQELEAIQRGIAIRTKTNRVVRGTIPIPPLPSSPPQSPPASPAPVPQVQLTYNADGIPVNAGKSPIAPATTSMTPAVVGEQKHRTAPINPAIRAAHQAIQTANRPTLGKKTAAELQLDVINCRHRGEMKELVMCPT